jgi:hypothetical protein
METLKTGRLCVPQLHDYEVWIRIWSLVVAGFMIYINYEDHVLCYFILFDCPCVCHAKIFYNS